MANLMLPFTLDELQTEIDLGYVKKTKHPNFDLYIYNYTNKTQFDGRFNNVTNNCRGLILDEDNNIVARPFPKFHNWEEHVGNHKPIPTGPISVTEKMDGSLGILYWYGGQPYIATRGSFTSDQAVEATKMFNEWYSKDKFPYFHNLAGNVTFVFEVIYPQNRIVVDYGNKRELVLLSSINNTTGKDYSLPSLFPNTVKHYDFASVEDVLASKQEDNREGFVVRFENGLRLKFKFDEYVRLHRLITQTTARDIWDLIRNNKPLDEMLDLVPDEFYDWIHDVVARLKIQFHEIEEQVYLDFNNKPETDDRKTNALYFQKCKYPGLLFLMLDGKMGALETKIWDMIRPEHELPFKKEI